MFLVSLPTDVLERILLFPDDEALVVLRASRVTQGWREIVRVRSALAERWRDEFEVVRRRRADRMSAAAYAAAAA